MNHVLGSPGLEIGAVSTVRAKLHPAGLSGPTKRLLGQEQPSLYASQ